MALDGSLDATIYMDVVEFTYQVTNRSAGRCTLDFASGKRFDIAVSPAGSCEPCWRASDDRVYPMVTGLETLGAGDTMVFDEQMHTPTPGVYEAVAWLAADGVDARATTRFRVA